jgi:methionyl-tRNA formyltransferase
MVKLYLLGKKGIESIKALNNRQISLVDFVVIGTDKNVIEDYSNEIKDFCTGNRINYSFRNSDSSIESEYNIAIGWRWLIKSNKKTIVFHDSLLPKYRGFAPLVSSLINNDNEIGATALLASDEFDKGDIIDQKVINIKYPIKINDAIELISALYSELLVSVINKIESNSITLLPQDNSSATYSLWRNDEDYFINWNWDASKIKRFIDSVGFPYLGAKTIIENEIITIYDSEEIEDVFIVNRDVGKVLFKQNNGIIVVCGIGLLKIQTLFKQDGTELDISKKFRLKLK